jgi:hypothetical protein
LLLDRALLVLPWTTTSSNEPLSLPLTKGIKEKTVKVIENSSIWGTIEPKDFGIIAARSENSLELVSPLKSRLLLLLRQH